MKENDNYYPMQAGSAVSIVLFEFNEMFKSLVLCIALKEIIRDTGVEPTRREGGWKGCYFSISGSAKI